MKKELKVVLYVLILLIIVVFYIVASSQRTINFNIAEQVKDVQIVSELDYSTMGDDYSDAIFEKYESIKFGTQKSGLFNISSEPIEWIVLDKQDKKALLMTKYIIDCKAFDYVDIENIDSISASEKSKYKDITWESSSLRKWLNTDFYNECFTKNEQSKIVETLLDDTKTNDKAFCLSEQEYKKYFDNNNYYDNLRQIEGLNAYYNGATIRNKKAISYDTLKAIPAVDTYEYWLRDKDLNIKEYGIEFGESKIVNYFGDVQSDINCDIYCGVRPAMWVSLE